MIVNCTDLYCDGGLVGSNPSKIGGAWACCFVDITISGSELIQSVSGYVSMEQAGQLVTNNYTELLAAIEGMERLPEGWEGRIWTDSDVTLRRLRKKTPKFTGIPPVMQERFLLSRAPLGDFRVFHVMGHPTAHDLKMGRGSKWNVLCDQLCTEAMQ